MISLIILTLNAHKTIRRLLTLVNRQTVIPDEIIVVDSQSADDTKQICSEFENVQFHTVKRSEFSHGGTRDLALRKMSNGDFIIFMTQDAIPANARCIEKLLTPFEDKDVAAAFSRQIPRKDATAFEKLVREFNYPEQSNVRSASDIDRMGIKAFFFSDVCAAYRRSDYFNIGGFENQVSTNEDMFFAAKALNKGYKIAYAADSAVIHSHNLSIYDQYMRNRKSGYEIEKHRELMKNVSSDNEGIKMVKYVSRTLLKEGKYISFIRFGLDCCARFFGSKSGVISARLRKT